MHVYVYFCVLFSPLIDDIWLRFPSTIYDNMFLLLHRLYLFRALVKRDCSVNDLFPEIYSTYRSISIYGDLFAQHSRRNAITSRTCNFFSNTLVFKLMTLDVDKNAQKRNIQNKNICLQLDSNQQLSPRTESETSALDHLSIRLR